MIALEFISDRLKALLDERRPAPSPEAAERIAALEAENALLARRLVAEGHARERLDAEIPALSESVAALQEHFDRLIIDARAEVPGEAQTRVADLEKRLAVAQADTAAARKERDEAVRTSESLALLRDACLRWDSDNYSPRLKNVIAVFRRQEVGKR